MIIIPFRGRCDRCKSIEFDGEIISCTEVPSEIRIPEEWELERQPMVPAQIFAMDFALYCPVCAALNEEDRKAEDARKRLAAEQKSERVALGGPLTGMSPTVVGGTTPLTGGSVELAVTDAIKDYRLADDGDLLISPGGGGISRFDGYSVEYQVVHFPLKTRKI